jgi:membrane protein
MAIIIDRLPHWRVGEVDVTGVARETVHEVSDDDVSGLSAEMAYHAILALFPFLLFLTGLTSLIDNVFSVGDLTDRIVDKAAQVMPEDATSVIRSFTEEVVNADGGIAIIIGLVGALWAASSAIGSAMKALNRAYDVKEDRGFVRRKLVALGLTFLFGGLMLIASLLVATGGIIAGGIGEALGWERQLVQLWNWLTLPAALLLVTLAVALLYWLAPNTSHQFRWITPGAALFTVGWVVASLGFAFYVSNFASYNRTYGSIGAVIILLVWLYWTNFLLLVGGELNAVLARRHDEEYRREAPPSRRSGSRAQP